MVTPSADPPLACSSICDMVRDKHGPEQAAMWLAVNQPRHAMDDPQLDTNLAAIPNYNDDDPAPDTSLGPSAT